MTEACERCDAPITVQSIGGRIPKRFCSEVCRRKAERARWQRRRRKIGVPVTLFTCCACEQPVTVVGSGRRPKPPHCSTCRQKLHRQKAAACDG